MLKVGVVGCGGISGSHVPNWQRMDDVEVVAVCDIRPEMFQKYPGPAHYEDFDKMLDENEFDIIDICLPTYLHAQFAIKAMKKGINVVSEKPIALEEEDVIAIYETAEKMNVKYMVAQCLRFWAEYEFVNSCYESGVYGKLLTANLWRLGGYPKRSFFDWYTKKELSGLIPFDLHIHDLDFLVYAFGAPKSYVFNRKELPGNDYLSATYDYGDFFVNTEASWYKAGYPFYMGFRFQFEQAVVALEKDGLTVYDANGNRSKPLSGEVGIANESDFDLPSGDAYFNELRYFANCVKENRPVEKVTKESLLTVLHILNEMK